MSAARPLRLGVVGARRVRAGTGPWLARHATKLGAEVVGILGTTSATVEEAAADLAMDGIQVHPCLSLDELITEVAPDALIVASPAGTHQAWLQQALEADLHVFCEKPLLAGLDISGQPLLSVSEETSLAQNLAREFSSQGLILRESCQWPETLAVWPSLYPDFDWQATTSFRMRLAPWGEGLRPWIEMLSHPLSLLQAIRPGPVTLESIRSETNAVQFRFATSAEAVQCRLEIAPDTTFPRPADYWLNDRLCQRRIREVDYGFLFVNDAGEEVPLEDPMVLVVERFLHAAQSARETGSAQVDENLVRRQFLVAELLHALQTPVVS